MIIFDSESSGFSIKNEIQQKFDKRPMTIEFYKIIRTYIDEENKLLNYRMTWLLTINGFLFASYAIILQRKIEKTGTVLLKIMQFDGISVFLSALCLLGILMCVNAINGIRGARRAVNYLENFVEISFSSRSVEIQNPPLKYQSRSVKLLENKILIPVGRFIWFLSGENLDLRGKIFANKMNEVRSIYCIEIEKDGILPFITGGGFHKPNRTTKMSSLIFIKYLLATWSFLLCFALMI